jgi:hypothetical protein
VPLLAVQELLAAAAEACATLYADLYGTTKPTDDEKLRVISRLRVTIRGVEGRG